MRADRDLCVFADEGYRLPAGGSAGDALEFEKSEGGRDPF